MSEILQTYKEYNYPGASKLYTILKGKYKLREITDALKGENVHQLYYQKPEKIGGHNLASNFGDKFQCDLCFLDKFGHSNKGHLYLLLVIDVFSRYAWAQPLKSKNIGEVTRAFESIGDYPTLLQSDNGSEFVGATFQQVLKEHNVIHRTSVVGDHKFLGIIDRFTLTLKNAIYKNFIGNDNTQWLDRIEAIVKTYNNTPHAGVYDFTPQQVKNDEMITGMITNINNELMQKQSKKINDISGNVRVKIPPTKFTRGFHPRWGNVETIDKRVGNIVYINGKKHKITSIQLVNGDNAPEPKELKKAIKEHKVKRALQAEGVSESNIVSRSKRERVIKYDASLIGRRINRGNGEKGSITKYEKDGPFHWYVKYDTKAKMKSEWMDASEVKQFLIK